MIECTIKCLRNKKKLNNIARLEGKLICIFNTGIALVHKRLYAFNSRFCLRFKIIVCIFMCRYEVQYIQTHIKRQKQTQLSIELRGLVFTLPHAVYIHSFKYKYHIMHHRVIDANQRYTQFYGLDVYAIYTAKR